MLKKIIAVSAIFMLSLSSVYAIEADVDYTDTVQQAETAETIDNESNDKDYIPADDELPDVTARNAVVIEAATGKVLYQRNKDIITYPASTTKIMTLIMALEHGNLDQQFTASEEASKTDGSTIWLEPGEKLTLRQLCYAMMLVSGNDATVAVAEGISGSVPDFALAMTRKAHQLGAISTNFVNPNGLPDPQHYTTAYDLARIAAYGYSLPGFEEIVSTMTTQIPWGENDYNRFLRNENYMLWIYDGANGVKTGYTEVAGHCLVSAAKRDGVQLISVVLGAESMWNDSIAMLDYGFSKVEPYTFVKAYDSFELDVKGGRKNKLKAHADKDIIAGIDPSEKELYSIQVVVSNELEGLKAPIAKGDEVGRVYLIYDGERTASAALIADEEIEKKSFFLSIWYAIKGFFSFVIGG